MTDDFALVTCPECGRSDEHAPECSHFPTEPAPELKPARPPRGPDKRPRKRRRARSPLAAEPGVPHRGLVDAAAAAAEGDGPTPASSGPASTVPAKRAGGGHVTKAQLQADNDRLTRENAKFKAQQDAAGTLDETQVAAALTGTFATLFGKILPKVLGVEGCAITDDEAATLGAAWAPVMAPLMAEHGDKAPLALALITTAGIGYRPVMAYLDARKPRELAPGPGGLG